MAQKTQNDEFVTKGYLDDKLDSAMKAQTEKIVGVLNDVMDRMDERFKKVDERFNKVDDKFAIQEIKTDARFNKIEEKLDNLQTDMTSVLNRLDSIENDIALNDDERRVMGMQLSRLHDWVEKTAKKVGVDFIH